MQKCVAKTKKKNSKKGKYVVKKAEEEQRYQLANLVQILGFSVAIPTIGLVGRNSFLIPNFKKQTSSFHFGSAHLLNLCSSPFPPHK